MHLLRVSSQMSTSYSLKSYQSFFLEKGGEFILFFFFNLVGQRRKRRSFEYDAPIYYMIIRWFVRIAVMQIK